MPFGIIAPDQHAVGWSDMIADLGIRGQGVNSPSWAVYRGGISGYAFSASQMNEAVANFHVNHDYLRGSAIYPHVHWSPNTAATGVVRWGFEYMVARGHQQDTYPTSTIVYRNVSVVPADQYRHFVTEVLDADVIPAGSIEPDTVIRMRVFRDATNAADTFPDAVHGITMDLHYRADRHATPNKAPNFYGT